MGKRGQRVTIIYEPTIAYDLTLGEAAELFRTSHLRGSPLETTSRMLTDLFIDRIEKFQPEMQSYVEVLADEARAQA
jgi:hypothetical protein